MCNVIMFYTIRFLCMLCQTTITRLATWAVTIPYKFTEERTCFIYMVSEVGFERNVQICNYLLIFRRDGWSRRKTFQFR
jgi:hypothetical protein